MMTSRAKLCPESLLRQAVPQAFSQKVSHGVQERDGNNTPTVAYTRGTDLSGALEGAGGIGGLLARSSSYLSGNWGLHNFYFADGNGNILDLVNGSQALAASYRYDPFGNLLSKSGSLADANVYRFSSKEFHANTGLYYYLYRFYDPNAQRWLNRDPLGAAMPYNGPGMLENELFPFEFFAGANLHQYAYNRPVLEIDPWGLDVWVIRDKCSKGGLHEIVVGSNSDGTYWSSDKNAGRGGMRIPILGTPLNCPANISFYRNTTINPNKLGPCYEVTIHIVTSPAVDAKVSAEAERRMKNERKERYDLCGNNCRDYANDLVGYTYGSKIREIFIAH